MIVVDDDDIITVVIVDYDRLWIMARQVDGTHDNNSNNDNSLQLWKCAKQKGAHEAYLKGATANKSPEYSSHLIE